jgi:hypothetical protein
VTFHLKTEPDGAMQYGLIAEEVDKVYPELVIRNAEGRIEGVRYDELAPIFLEAVQQQHIKLQNQNELLVTQKQQLVVQGVQLEELSQQIYRFEKN